MAQVVSSAVREEGSLQWDIYSQSATDTEVHIRENAIESIRSPIRSQGYALRVIRSKGDGEDGKPICGIGISPGNLLEDQRDVSRALAFALSASKMTSAPDYLLPSEKKSLPSVKISDPKITSDQYSSARDLAEKVVTLLDREKDIRATFCKVRLTEIKTTLENCNGLRSDKSETFAAFEAGLSPKTTLAEYWPMTLTRRIEDLDLEQNIPKWARFARDSAKAKPPKTEKRSLILPPGVLSEIAPPVVGFHASSSALKRGLSKWQNTGIKVWSDKVSISDDGLLDYGLGTSPFDDEGTAQQRTKVITRGEFSSYISNAMYASFVSSGNTGNGIKPYRSGGVLCYSRDVDLDSTNIVMEAGDSSYEEMIKGTSRGLLVEQFSWMFPDPITGTFGAEIRHAYLVENGEITDPIKGGVVNGSFFDSESGTGTERGVFNSLDLISRERGSGRGSLLPYVRFPDIRISGE